MRHVAREDRFVLDLVERLPRSPRQLNRPHESDAELLRLPGSDAVLAVTVDQIVEEVRAGLYDDPFLVGWMAVAACASDLAAVGAEPLGIVVGETFPPGVTSTFRSRLQLGLARASEAARLPVLGGDTAFDRALSISGTGIGVIPDGRPLTRRGAAAGQRLLATGPLGLGSAFAWAKCAGRRAPGFQPPARLAVGALARGVARAATDTSDGFLAACDLLLPPDGLDLDVTAPPAVCLHPAARALARELGVPEWVPLAGPHGEFELLLAVPAEHVEPLRAAARDDDLPLFEVGVFRPGTGLVRIPWADAVIDPAAVRDLHSLAPTDPRAFLRALLEVSHEAR